MEKKTKQPEKITSLAKLPFLFPSNPPLHHHPPPPPATMNAAQSLPPPLSAPSPLPTLSPSSPSLSGLTASSSQLKAQPQAQQLPSESTAAEVRTAVVFVACASQSVPVASTPFHFPPCASREGTGGHQVRLPRGPRFPPKNLLPLTLFPPSFPIPSFLPPSIPLPSLPFLLSLPPGCSSPRSQEGEEEGNPLHRSRGRLPLLWPRSARLRLGRRPPPRCRRL